MEGHANRSGHYLLSQFGEQKRKSNRVRVDFTEHTGDKYAVLVWIYHSSPDTGAVNPIVPVYQILTWERARLPDGSVTGPSVKAAYDEHFGSS
jgi:hypothetical protein